MRPLHLDFQSKDGLGLWAGWLVLIAAVMLSTYLIHRHNTLKAELDDWRSRLVNQTGLTDSGNVRADPEKLGAEIAAADEAAMHMALPWGKLFKALENTHQENIALLQVRPDASNKTLTLVAEAKNLTEMTAYLDKLGKQAMFYSVHLEEHEIQQQENPPRVRFKVSAVWQMNGPQN